MSHNGKASAIVAEPGVVVANTRPLLRLDLGAGENVREGFEGVDFFAPNAKHKVNLTAFPWPWADNSVEELHSSHFLEHLPMVYVRPGPSGETVYENCPTDPAARDLLCRFMDEAYRVLIPGGKFTVIVPSGRSDRSWQDPTHRRAFFPTSLSYFSKRWREANRLGHYLCSCDFEGPWQNIFPIELTTLCPEAQAKRLHEGWNTTIDFRADFISQKPR